MPASFILAPVYHQSDESCHCCSNRSRLWHFGLLSSWLDRKAYWWHFASLDHSTWAAANLCTPTRPASKDNDRVTRLLAFPASKKDRLPPSTREYHGNKNNRICLPSRATAFGDGNNSSFESIRRRGFQQQHSETYYWTTDHGLYTLGWCANLVWPVETDIRAAAVYIFGAMANRQRWIAIPAHYCYKPDEVDEKEETYMVNNDARL